MALVTWREQVRLTLTLILLASSVSCGGGASVNGNGPPPGPGPLAISSHLLPQGLVGTPYNAKLQAEGGTPPYTWSSQVQIAGLTFGADGSISGTPTTPGTYIPSFTVHDAGQQSTTSPVELDIFSALAFITPSSLPDQNIGFPVYLYIQANGGKGPWTYSLASGASMPPGLSFKDVNGAGLIQGTPTTKGTFSFALQVTDSSSPVMTSSQVFTMNILNNLGLPQTSLPDAVLNLPYQAQIQPIGGTPPYHFALHSTMPSGLTLDSASGIVSGTPTAVTVFNSIIIVTISDSAVPPATIDPFITLNVQPALSIQSASLPDSASGLYYFGNINVTGGRSPYTAQVISGNLPGGLTLGPWVGRSLLDVSGIANTDGLFAFTVQISDSYSPPNTVQQSYQVRISDQMKLTGPNSASILYNQPYTATFPVTGGYPPYKWSMGSVPAGFTFDSSTGTLSGTPAPPYASPPLLSVVSVSDSSNPPLHSNSVYFQLNVYGQLMVTTSSLPAIASGRQSWLGLHASGGVQPYTWSLTSGSLPAGMTFNGGSGLLQGTPTAPGTYPFTVSISDGNTGSLHQTASRTLALTVEDPTQMQRNDALTDATPISNLHLLASISPYSDPGSNGPDLDVYQASASPGARVDLAVSAGNSFLQTFSPGSLLPILEVVDASGNRYQTCTQARISGGGLTLNYPCINALDGSFYSNTFFSFQVPGSGTAPVTFYIRVSDARGDARPDFIYTLSVDGVK